MITTYIHLQPMYKEFDWFFLSFHQIRFDVTIVTIKHDWVEWKTQSGLKL